MELTFSLKEINDKPKCAALTGFHDGWRESGGREGIAAKIRIETLTGSRISMLF